MDCSSEKEKFITDMLNKSKEENVLSPSPTVHELLPYIKLNIKKKRILKKILKRPLAYMPRLPKKIRIEFMRKSLAKSFSEAILDTLNREGFARQVFNIQPLSLPE